MPDPSTSSTASTTGDPDPSSSESGSESSTTSEVDPCTLPWDPGPQTWWPRYGLDDANSRHNRDEAAITAHNVHCLQRAWTVDRLAGVTSTPAVVDGTIYIGDWAGFLRAYDFETGAEQWSVDVGAQVNDSPLVTDDTVYVGDGTGFLHAVARDDGSVRWSVELDPHEYCVIYSSPVLAGDMLVVGVASTELATVVDDFVFRGAVVGLDPATGAEQWRFYTTENDETAGAGVSVWSTAAVDPERGLVYIGTGNTYEQPAAPMSDSLLAIDYATGALEWHRQFTEGDVYIVFEDPPSGPDADVGAAPNLFTIGDRDVVGVGDKAGVYSVLDRDDGETVWATMLTEGSHLGGVMTTAAVDDTAIYLASNIWQPGFNFGDPDNVSVLFALDRETGDVLWQRDLDRPVFGAMTLAGGVVYHGTIDGRIHAVAASDGSALWSDLPGGDVGGGFTVVNGTLVAGHGFWFFTEPASATGGLVAYRLPAN